MEEDKYNLYDYFKNQPDDDVRYIDPVQPDDDYLEIRLRGLLVTLYPDGTYCLDLYPQVTPEGANEHRYDGS